MQSQLSPPTFHGNNNSTNSIDKEDLLQFHLNTQHEEPTPINIQTMQPYLLTIPEIKPAQLKFKTTSLITIKRTIYNASCHRRHQDLCNTKK